MASLYDLTLVLIVYIIVIMIIGLTEIARKKLNLSSKITRRVIHLFAGDTILFLPLFTDKIYPALLPIGLGLMTAIAFAFKKSFLTTTMIEEEDVALHAYGPVYYIISILILVLTLWDKKYIAMAATMVMAWGDGSAPIIARKVKNTHKYIGNRTIEGSLSMLAFGFLGALLAITTAMQIEQGYITWQLAILRAAIASIVGTIAEALSIGPLKHFDNFTVPLLSALALYFTW
ncbi:MAG: hypothetical protein DRJ26_01740 [Candidatus Methanomethylicota archaeon]|uniref:Phosphatidate cytidylyltransferase n=1 Tax=Thermoproteota archaeon TaxID=2056631 RepID=A0A497EZ85_9CREN|nr:MAG: hypothetical protein DRJ20_00310 [Candidatus Verstraetearchaeota archaeon]RLE54577.1 MAG: hypothetical protein DRJ26_01740 [Candidatus Verstraetearchaeota archaeon]